MSRWNESGARSVRVWTSYFYPDSDVLQNKLGLRDRAELKQAEYKVTAARDFELRRRPVAATRDLAHLQAIHHALFRDVYEWAGELRQVNMGRGDPARGGIAFIDYRYLALFGRRLLEPALQAEGLTAPHSHREYSLYAGAALALTNTLHPFREGNGRAQFALIRQLSREAGYRLDVGALAQQREEVYQAAEASHAAIFRVLKKEQRLPTPREAVEASVRWQILIERASEPTPAARARDVAGLEVAAMLRANERAHARHERKAGSRTRDPGEIER